MQYDRIAPSGFHDGVCRGTLVACEMGEDVLAFLGISRTGIHRLRSLLADLGRGQRLSVFKAASLVLLRSDRRGENVKTRIHWRQWRHWMQLL